jgi:PAB1-binding protein PBP1
VPIIPLPPAAGPDPGQPGHFAHHDWLEAAVQSLDEAASSNALRLSRILAGNATVSANNVNITNSVVVTFPVGLFTATPMVFLQAHGTGSWIAYTPLQPTSASMTIAAVNRMSQVGTVTNLRINWLAFQYTAADIGATTPALLEEAEAGV